MERAQGDRDDDRAAWARQWLARCRGVPQVVLTRTDGAHAAAFADSPHAGLVVAYDAEAPDAFDPPRVVTSSGVGFEALARRSLALALDVYRADPPETLCGGAPAPAVFARAVERSRRAALVEQGTLVHRAALWLENLELNLPRIVEGPSAARLVQACRGLPALVVGAGPSLQESLPRLAALGPRAVVIAASSAVRPLLRAGIEPDAVVMIEGRSCLHHFDGVPDSAIARSVLLAESSTSPDHFELPFAHRAVFHGGVGEWLAPWSGRGSVVPVGGNVGTAAILLAWMLGADPVVVTGLDFALAGDRYYADGSGSRSEEHDGQPAQLVAGWAGTEVHATAELVCYREQTEQVLATVAARGATTRFAALAARGARVEGMTVADDRLIDELLARPRLASGWLGRALEACCRHDQRMPRDVDGVAARAGQLTRELARLHDSPRGPAFSLATAHPATTLPMLVAAPPLIEARLSRAGLDSEHRGLDLARARFDRVAQRALELMGAGVAH